VALPRAGRVEQAMTLKARLLLGSPLIEVLKMGGDLDRACLIVVGQC
jgi:hypothetical protein